MRAPLAAAATLVVIAGGFGIGFLAGRSGGEAPPPAPAPTPIAAAEAPAIPALDDGWEPLPPLRSRPAAPAATGSSSASTASAGSSAPAADPDPADDDVFVVE